jgi:hypothetical protein
VGKAIDNTVTDGSEEVHSEHPTEAQCLPQYKQHHSVMQVTHHLLRQTVTTKKKKQYITANAGCTNDFPSKLPVAGRLHAGYRPSQHSNNRQVGCYPCCIESPC